MLKGKSKTKRRQRSLWGELIAILIMVAIGTLLVLGIMQFVSWYKANTSLFWILVLFLLPVANGCLIFLWLKNRLNTMGSGSVISTTIIVVGVMNVIAQYLW